MRISSSQSRSTGRTIRHCLVRPAAVRRRCRTDSRTVTFRGAGPADDCAPDPPLSIRKSRTVRRLPTGPVTPRDRSDRRRLARGPVCHPARQIGPPGRPAPQLRRPAPFPRGGSGFPPRSPDHRTPADPPRSPGSVLSGMRTGSSPGTGSHPAPSFGGATTGGCRRRRARCDRPGSGIRAQTVRWSAG